MEKQTKNPHRALSKTILGDFNVKKNRGIVFFISTVCLALSSASLFAQGAAPAAAPKPAPLPVRIGVINYFAVTQAHPKFNAEMKKLRERAINMKTDFASREKLLIDQEQKIRQNFTIGTDDYSQAAGEVTKQASDLNIEFGKAELKLTMEESALALEMLDSIDEEIAKIAQRGGFSTIVNRSMLEDETLLKDTRALAQVKMQSVQNVVWSIPEYDITNYVIQALNARYASTYPKLVDIQNGKRVVLSKSAAPGVNPSAVGNRPVAPAAGAGAVGRPNTQNPPLR